MKFLHLLLLALGLGLAQAALHAADAPAATPAPAATEKLVGTWLDQGPKDLAVTFNKDGTFKVHLKKGDGGDLHSVDGTWKLTPDMNLTTTIIVDGETKNFSSQATIKGDVMTAKDGEGNPVKLKRIVGALPERFVW